MPLISSVVPRQGHYGYFRPAGAATRHGILRDRGIGTGRRRPGAPSMSAWISIAWPIRSPSEHRLPLPKVCRHGSCWKACSPAAGTQSAGSRCRRDRSFTRHQGPHRPHRLQHSAHLPRRPLAEGTILRVKVRGRQPMQYQPTNNDPQPLTPNPLALNQRKAIPMPSLHHRRLPPCDHGLLQRPAHLTFYREVLGLSTVKKTVNFDLPDTYHLFRRRNRRARLAAYVLRVAHCGPGAVRGGRNSSCRAWHLR